MKLKKIYLENIRSYENQEIEFPEGSVLLSGDIGSGKTSILLAIEFALFGIQPGQKGNALLRNGKDSGKVKIEFEIDGKEISIERTLKRKKNISQEYCSISIGEDFYELSVTELKSKVLELLNYPKEFSKKQNILYKFTVYTPQEDMKQIILQDSETRLNTLRHVFGIDKYKRILENSSIVISKIKEMKKLKEGYILNLEDDKKNLEEKKEEIKSKNLNLESLNKELSSKKDLRLQAQEELEDVEKKIEEKRKLQQEIEKINIAIVNKKDSISSNKKIAEQLEKQISEIEKIPFEEETIQKLEKALKIKRRELEILREENLKISSDIASLNIQNQDKEKIKERLKKLEMCPVCLQNVDAVYKSNVINQIEKDSVEIIKKIGFLEIEKKKLSEKVSKTEFEISEIQKEISDKNILKIKLQGAAEKRERINEIFKTNELLSKDISLLEEQRDLLKNSIVGLNKFDSIYESKKLKLDEAFKEERAVEIKLAEIKKEIEVFSRQIEELKKRIEKAEQAKSELRYLSDMEDWMMNKFIPAISIIEKNVMIKVRSEFSSLFEKWFGMLVSENFNVKINEDFTPVIEVQDYEIDYAYLSGGERTAVALAYRLALNQIINSVISTIKTKDLVILDEPTDGFSEQQLDKMRDVLDELNVAQLIIVSHEQKIEGFVDNVIRLRKENGTSKKT